MLEQQIVESRAAPLEDENIEQITQKLEENGATLKFVKDAVNEFEKATSNFMGDIENVKQRNNPLEIRIINDQMMQLERVFLLPRGNYYNVI